MVQDTFVGAVDAHVRCTAPHSTISEIVRCLPTPDEVQVHSATRVNAIQVLYVGFRHVWPLLALAEARPDLVFIGFDEDWSVVKRVRKVAEARNITNLTYLDTSFGILRKSRKLFPFDYVLFVPPLYDMRPNGKVHASRMRTIANCFDLLAPKGVFVWHAAMGMPKMLRARLEYEDYTIIDTIAAWCDTVQISDAVLREELGSIKTYADLSRFLLMYFGRGYYAEPTFSCAVQCQQLKSERTLFSIPTERGLYTMHQGDGSSACVYIGNAMQYVNIVKDIDFYEVQHSFTRPQILTVLWKELFHLSDAVVRRLPITGTIHAIKP
jgi:hypothetical protein